MKEVYIGAYSLFAMEYLDGQYPHERFGQAFMNKFYTGTSLTDSQLFYCEDKTQAVDIIFARYITCEPN
jgi:hypothetical protein